MIRLVVLTVSMALALVGCRSAGAGSGQANIGPARFVFSQKAADGAIREFVFEVSRPEQIAEARAILRDPSNPKRHVQGTIKPVRMPYNPRWSFHLVPESVGFFELQIEVCDANVTYVEANLDAVGGSFLPRSFWCPWSSNLERELNP